MDLTFNQNSTFNRTQGTYLANLNQILFNRQQNRTTRFPRPSRRPSFPTRRPLRPPQPFIPALFRLVFRRTPQTSESIASALASAIGGIDENKIEVYDALTRVTSDANEDPITKFSRMIRAVIASKVNFPN